MAAFLQVLAGGLIAALVTWRRSLGAVIVGLAVAFEDVKQGGSGYEVLHARMRVLPADLFPVLRAYLDVSPPRSGRERFEQLLEKEPDLRNNRWIRAAAVAGTVHSETTEAIERLLAERMHGGRRRRWFWPWGQQPS
jgi:hypothetical protein